jgi:hypothetical protein
MANMLLHFRALLIVSMVLGVTGVCNPLDAATLTRTETFDSDALDQFDEIGGTHDTGNDFGFSNSNNVGLGGGEAGGTMARSQTIRAYADLDLGGALHRNEPLHLDGTLTVKDLTFNGALMIGFFNKDQLAADAGPPFIGLVMWEPWTPNFRAFPMVYETGVPVPFARQFHPIVELSQNVPHTFSLDWVPNPDGSGVLSGVIDGTAVSKIVTSTVADTFDAFGIGTGLALEFPPDDPLKMPFDQLQAQMFVDNLTYSIVPEPGSIVLMAVGLTLLVGKAAYVKSQRGKYRREHSLGISG